jgi:hypothetical protein
MYCLAWPGLGAGANFDVLAVQGKGGHQDGVSGRNSRRQLDNAGVGLAAVDVSRFDGSLRIEFVVVYRGAAPAWFQQLRQPPAWRLCPRVLPGWLGLGRLRRQCLPPSTESKMNISLCD